MKRVDCEFEPEALAAALQSRWPGRVDAVLREHVAGCPICSDVVMIAGAVDAARDETRAEARLPDAGRIWWVARMRARREAAKAANRPITAIQVIALTCAMGLLGACFGATSQWFQSMVKSAGSSLSGIDFGSIVPAVISLIAEHGALALAGGTLLLLVPAAVCYAMLKE
jgi:predicted anti-sigma-YlaC factor YlaD